MALAAKLIEAGVMPRELRLGLPSPDLEKAGYDPNAPRVPAGNHRGSGDWTKGGASASTLTEGRSAGAGSGKPHPVPELPKDASVVTQPDGTTIDNPKSPTGSSWLRHGRIFMKFTLQERGRLRLICFRLMRPLVITGGSIINGIVQQKRIIQLINMQAITQLAYSWRRPDVRVNIGAIFLKHLRISTQVTIKQTSWNENIGHSVVGTVRTMGHGSEVACLARMDRRRRDCAYCPLCRFVLAAMFIPLALSAIAWALGPLLVFLFMFAMEPPGTGCDEGPVTDSIATNARGDAVEEYIKACTGIGTVVDYSIDLQLRGDEKTTKLAEYADARYDYPKFRWSNDESLSIDLGKVGWVSPKTGKVGSIDITYVYSKAAISWW